MARPVGWILTKESRSALLDRFPPRHEDVIAHHVTLWSRKAGKRVPPPASFAVVGHADDGRGNEALVVSVDGTTDRPDGGTFHITWSIDPDSALAPKHSNDLLAEADWSTLDAPIPFEAEPGFL